MIHATFRLLLYGLLAAFSAIAFAATIAVMRAGRLKTLGFGTGFVIGQLFTCSLFVIVGVAATGASNRPHPVLIATLELLLAVLLIVVALRFRRVPQVETESSGKHKRAAVERLSRLRFLTTSIAGFLLGIGGPKRLLLTALACGVPKLGACPRNQRFAGRTLILAPHRLPSRSITWSRRRCRYRSTVRCE